MPGALFTAKRFRNLGDKQPAWATSLFACQERLFQHQVSSDKQSNGATDFQLSLGKIRDTLHADYPAFFERSPDFDIYDDSITIELNLDNEDASPRRWGLQGKRKYKRLISGFQNLAATTVREGEIRSSVKYIPACGQTLQVKWTCVGQVALFTVPVHISAVSNYSIAPRSQDSFDVPTHVLSHLIHHHTVEIVEIHPPSLRTWLQGFLLPRMQPEPTLAYGTHANSILGEVDTQTWDVEASLSHA
jgi:hypothetical protein